jgi:hypothetical protein
MTHRTPRCVCVESPLRGDVTHNVQYADACMHDALELGEAPFLGHLLYPRVINDEDAVMRARGIEAHLAWLRRADIVAVYSDFGITDGMRAAIDLAQSVGLDVEFRTLGLRWLERIAALTPTPGFR